jgi:uncharacterized Zn finger protein (UPF0148 family)
MGKNDLAYALGLLAGAVLGYVLLKAIIGENTTCPNCRNPLKKGVLRCPNCGVWLQW